MTMIATRGKLFDVQKLLTKTGMEFHWPGYQYLGPGTYLEKRLARGDPGINRLDRIAKAHDIDYGKAKDLKDKWAADRPTERIVKNITGQSPDFSARRRRPNLHSNHRRSVSNNRQALLS